MCCCFLEALNRKFFKNMFSLFKQLFIYLFCIGLTVKKKKKNETMILGITGCTCKYTVYDNIMLVYCRSIYNNSRLLVSNEFNGFVI